MMAFDLKISITKETAFMSISPVKDLALEN